MNKFIFNLRRLKSKVAKKFDGFLMDYGKELLAPTECNEKIKELLLSNGWDASYAVVDKNFAKEAQKMAEEYLFDMKILVKIESEREMIELAKDFIDGIIFERSIIDGKN